MPVRGINQVRVNIKRAFDDIEQKRTEAAVYAVLSEGAALAQTKVPMDTGTLANSQYAPIIDVMPGKVAGTVGYTAAYAGAVHEMEGTLKGQPRDPNNPGRGDFWDPNAEPEFLTKGFEELKPAIPAILKAAHNV